MYFDAQELWRVRVRLESAQGNAETVATVEATPPGYGRWDLLVYLIPFLAIGALWAVAAHSSAAPVAAGATEIDLAHYAAADQ